jgi:hypothetical protein
MLPREEYPLRHRHGNLSWPTLLDDFSVNTHPAFMAYIAQFGANSARQLYDEHLSSTIEWWIEREMGESLPAFREVLRRMFDRQFLCKVSWEQLCVQIKLNHQYEQYFRPFGRSLGKHFD